VGANSLSVLLTGNQFIVTIPVSLLPSTGAAPADYAFNIWPRDPNAPGGGNFQISDFAPDNALLTSHGALPEPGTWGMMLLGFGLIGGAMRFRRNRSDAMAQLA
jgi:hypothetical protein